MIQQIIISTEAWFVPLCVFAGVFYAIALYYRENRYEFSVGQRIFMGGIRAITVSFIVFFLLSPFFRSTTKKVEEPIILIAQDHSASIVSTKDSAFYLNQYPSVMQTLTEELEQDYDVNTYSFGERFREGSDFIYTDKQSNISEMLIELQSRYLNRNVGALIVASDGIFNQGIHPLYALEYLPYPVYTIALGDTTPLRDAAVINVAHNRIAYLNNTFPLEVHVRGTLCDGLGTTLRILKNGELLFSERIVFSGNNDNRFIPVQLSADQTGLQRYKIQLLAVEGETTTGNNAGDVFIEVLEARQKVLLLYSAPHPDVSAIHQTLEALENMEAEVFDASQFNGNLQEYSLVVLHQVPSQKQAYSSLLQRLNNADIPLLHIIGSGSDLSAFNALGYGFTIMGSGQRLDETLPALNPSFALFTLSDEFIESLRFFPPLYSPFATYRESIASNPLFYRQIGSLPTDAPLMTFVDFSGKKIGIITGEGIWRWRLANFNRRGNHDAFNEWLSKSMQFLALREQKDRFMVQTKNTWNENEVIEFSAEFYNESFEPLTSPEVEMIISDEEGKEYPFTFSRSGIAYTLKVGSFEPGNYSYTASTAWQSQDFKADGAFSVLPLEIEFINIVADHRLMMGLAQRFRGEMFDPSQTENIVELIRARNEVKPVFYFEKNYLELIDIKWLLILLIVLLASEWIFRRIAGGY